MEMNSFFKKLESEHFLPLYTVTSMEYLAKAENILKNNNLSFIEITYRSELASKAIKQLSESDELIVGAGTVRSLDTAKEAVENGAKFIVTPGFSDEIVTYCIEKNIPILPGTVTPSEIMRAQSYGLKVVKFFPANVYGGLDAVKSLSGPFSDIKFVPTGGVNKTNYQEFIENPNILAIGGSFILSEKAIIKDEGFSAEQSLAELVAPYAD
ncbi:bifunctional 4-hydroxy-2-oxoglutarate aldolase/2-dehydro-3-deoxy-phosphogluconate aldolase [Tetragenococcus solitarius]|uniref:Bifunctional 4-hydroxy-2-oxoglutarate aldolase/2-dehydro-3-deoxy-phosphogluconate aldolase n=1 Tax=Tetragenococcus solitarius TaxID=71453 RepID=A0ABN3Y8H6_9ENTE|nr:bifunctional 4-hydroxy-2-oxoglutarate aldolase/2-dehydro-3-deoxy-phosphogluconate aldolase [Tetragenococcus solitarius]